MEQDKRRHRELKRAIKKAGNRKLRRALARDLAINPEEAAHAEIDHGQETSVPFNGNDTDTKRNTKVKVLDAE